MAILTISRELGASGAYIALKVAERMGYTCYDQQILNAIAERMGREKEQLQQFEQTTYSRIGVFFQEALDSLAKGGVLFHPFGLGAPNLNSHEVLFSSYPQQSFKERDYYDVLKQVMNELADEGKAVFLGRGGSQLLRHRKNTLHLRVVADLKDRIRNIVEEQKEGGPLYDPKSNYKFGINNEEDIEKAQKLIQDWDTASANFISDFFDTDWNDPHNYHMIINTSRLNPDLCVEQIVAALKTME